MSNVILEKIYTKALVNSDTNKIYVYGDNLEGWGTAGQAIIRSCPNTVGMPTKRSPKVSPDAYFSDQEDEYNAVHHALGLIKKHLKDGKTIVLPYHGLGTGLARMEHFSPMLFRIMNKKLQELCPEFMA